MYITIKIVIGHPDTFVIFSSFNLNACFTYMSSAIIFMMATIRGNFIQFAFKY